MSDVDHLLHKATQAADVLKAHLRTIAGDDEDAIRDTMEGEIDLKGLISWAAEEDVKDDGLVEGLERTIRSLTERKKRIEKRVDLRREAILTAMQAGELRRVETPCGTISRKATAAKVLILSEEEIPSDYWKTPEPELDKKAIADALKAGTEIKGAMMSNGGETIQIKV